ncbi:hypothetical protein [Demequina zhanjiangensis]|uniref:PQQ-like domain-containing protein n=1 Tax=Demequina zhanjiangensis TaxID=3051659 RepID=A0ABT8G4A2_9MICO|nr:hypothetical protein [Demequina sp. SYSU T00b26]MDN4473842.1 hypothetical protein [Demequina sp. SYSU T00b26]
MSRTLSLPARYGTLGVALALGLTACATADAAGDASPSEHADDHAHEEGEAQHGASEASAQTPRLVMTYDGGIVVVDANSLELEADLELEGFNRINPLGDGRHVAVSTAGGFQVLDAGTWSSAHGDHAHYFTGPASLTELMVAAEQPGHVVVHDGLTTLFDDGTGDVSVFHADDWAHMVEEGHLDTIRTYTTAAAHHGVAVTTDEGNLMVTLGDEEGRTGAMLLDSEDQVLTENAQCPGVHGETAFADAEGDHLVMVGCDDGVLILHGDHFHKIDSGLDYARTGNLYSVDGSSIVAGDRKTDPDAGIGLHEIVLIDTDAETMSVVDPFGGAEAQYTWRDVRRGDDGQVLVLGTDGTLRVLDETGAVTAEIPVVDAWDIPEEWQTAHPAVEVLAGMAYVTEPATGEVHIVDYVGGEIWKSVEVGVQMNEIVGVTG